MPKIKINDINIYYEIHGQGQTLIFISGFASDHNKWSGIISEFAKDYQVIVLDNRGVGQSDCPEYHYTIGMMADDVAELCRKLNIKSAFFVGSSMGGAIVQTIAYKYANLVDAAVISCSAAKFGIKLKLMIESDKLLRKIKAPAEISLNRSLCDLFSENYLNQEGVVTHLLSIFADNPYPITDQGYNSQAHALFEFDSRNWLCKIITPVLVIYSDEDPLIDQSTSKFLISNIPNAKSYCFHEVGHVPDIEQPAQFIKLVREFLRNKPV